MLKFRKKIMIVICCIILVLSGCNPIVDSVQQESKEKVDYLIVNKGEIILPLTPFSSLNPIMNNNESYYHFSKLIFDSLFELDESLQPIPSLVNTYDIKDGGKTISLGLRQDVYWHDGEKFTADDVLFSVNVINNAGGSTPYIKMIETLVGASFLGGKGNVLSASIIDDYNIDIKFKEGYNNNLEILTFPIIASHRFKNPNGTFNLALALKMDEYIPVGTGPYKYESYDKFKSVNLVANQTYREGKPSITSIKGKVLGNEDLYLTAYEAGQIHISPVRDVDWDKYKQNTRIRTIEYISSDYEFLGFNFNNQMFSQDKGSELRKAMYYGIDRQEIIQKLYLGHASQVDVPIHPNSWLLSDEANIYGYNADVSKELLSINGYLDKDGDGIREDENGNKLSFKLITNPSNQLRLRIAEMLRDDLRDVGIDIILDFKTINKEDISKEDKAKEWEELNNRLLTGDFDIALLGWQMSVIPDLSSFFHSSQVGKGNLINYNNATMDDLLIKYRDSNDLGNKKLVYSNLQGLIIDDLPYLSLFYRNRAIVVDSSINGDLKPTFFNLYKGLEKCFMATKTELS